MTKKKIHFKVLRNRAFNFILEEMVERFPEQNRIMLMSILLTYIDNKGDNAVADLYGFFMYCRDVEHEDGFIWENIMHDINGRDDRFMSPRTSGYAAEFFEIQNVQP